MSAAPKFVSPMEGRFTSGYNMKRWIMLHGRRVFSPHAGIDIAPRIPGQIGSTIHAARSGRIMRIVRGRRLGQPASVGPVIATGRSGDGGVIDVDNSDDVDLYNHVLFLAKHKANSRVTAGDVLGTTNRSGIQSGPHLHFETWETGSANSHKDPARLFRAAGIAIGSKPVIAKAPSKPTPKPPAKPKPKPTQNAIVKARLKKMGLAQNAAGISAFQKAHGLPGGGGWGPKTEAIFQWNVKRQVYLNEWRRVSPKLIVDGYYGKASVRAEQQARAGATSKVPFRPPAKPKV